MSPMSRVQTIAMLSVLFAPAIAQACPMAAAERVRLLRRSASLLTYIVLFGGGLVAGIGSIALRRG